MQERGIARVTWFWRSFCDLRQDGGSGVQCFPHQRVDAVLFVDVRCFVDDADVYCCLVILLLCCFLGLVCVVVVVVVVVVIVVVVVVVIAGLAPLHLKHTACSDIMPIDKKDRYRYISRVCSNKIQVGEFLASEIIIGSFRPPLD